LSIQQSAIQGQGGLDGVLVSPQQVLQTASKLVTRLGFKTPELFFKDPNAPAPEPQPQDPSQTPEAMALQAELQGKLQVEQVKAQTQLQMAQMKAQNDLQIQQARLQAEMAFRAQKEQALMAQAQQVASMRAQLDV